MSGYSGWIKNANNTSHMKFMHYLKNIEKEVNFDLTRLSSQQILNLYNEDYVPENTDPGSIFYHIREAHISSKIRNTLKNMDDYLVYLKNLEGATNRIKIQNYGFDSFFIIDGFFEVQISYNESFEISTVNKKLRTAHKF